MIKYGKFLIKYHGEKEGETEMAGSVLQVGAAGFSKVAKSWRDARAGPTHVLALRWVGQHSTLPHLRFIQDFF